MRGIREVGEEGEEKARNWLGCGGSGVFGNRRWEERDARDGGGELDVCRNEEVGEGPGYVHVKGGGER